MIKEINNVFQVVIVGGKEKDVVEWHPVEQDTFGRPQISQAALDWCEENGYHPPLKFRFGERLIDFHRNFFAKNDEFDYYFTFLDYNAAMHFNLRWE